MRLRPSGHKGPVATQLSSFIEYQANEAWTWEHLALDARARHRRAAGADARVEAAIRTALVKPRDRAKIAADVLDMRERIAKEKGTGDTWELKQVRGGLVDLEFIAQFLQLVHASSHPEVLDQNTVETFRRLRNARVLDPAAADILIPATRLLHDLTQIVRLCVEGPFDPATAPQGAAGAAGASRRCGELFGPGSPSQGDAGG